MQWLDSDCCERVLLSLSIKSSGRMSCVSKAWKNLVDSSKVWYERVSDNYFLPRLDWCSHRKWKSMCKRVESEKRMIAWWSDTERVFSQEQRERILHPNPGDEIPDYTFTLEFMDEDDRRVFLRGTTRLSDGIIFDPLEIVDEKMVNELVEQVWPDAWGNVEMILRVTHGTQTRNLMSLKLQDFMIFDHVQFHVSKDIDFYLTPIWGRGFMKPTTSDLQYFKLDLAYDDYFITLRHSRSLDDKQFASFLKMELCYGATAR